MSATKKIRLLTSVAGTAYSYGAGQIVDAPAEIADDLIRGGHAVLEGLAKIENASSKQAGSAEKR